MNGQDSGHFLAKLRGRRSRLAAVCMKVNGRNIVIRFLEHKISGSSVIERFVYEFMVYSIHCKRTSEQDKV